MNLFIAASALGLAAVAQHPHHGEAPKLGTIAFETQCTAEASARFRQGLGWLHSFEYEQAAQTFAEAAAADPQCAIAHWGIAMSQYHPLWAPPSAAELQKGADALARAQAGASASERERAFIAALAAFYQSPERLDHKARATAYSEAMRKLHQRYPQDQEAAIFYALSLIAAGTMDKDPGYAKERQAALILNRILAVAPDHPGVAHYLIHGFDYPALAELALPAARRYAGIAPASPHAQHMPSHIFVRLGLWKEAIGSNLASESASRSYARAHGLPDSSSERLHAMDYLAYAYLQTGQDRDAERILAQLNGIRRADPPVFTVAYAATAIPARLALERRRWQEAASLELQDNVRNLAPLDDFEWAKAHLHFARSVGAARSGKVEAARAEAEKLRTIEASLNVPAGTYDWRMPVAVERQIATAWVAAAEGQKDDAVRLMRAAADLDDATEKHPVTPGAILPAREQLGELLLELGRGRDALTEYESALKRAPGRLAGLYGAARSARLAGDRAKASAYFRQIVEMTRDGDASRPEIAEARRFASERPRR
jgi:tetratricopeptide (TPR) repeat protein